MSKGKAVTLTTSDTADKVMEVSSSTAGTGVQETFDIVGVTGDQKTNASVSIDENNFHATVPETGGGGGGSTDGESQKESHHSPTKSTAARLAQLCPRELSTTV